MNQYHDTVYYENWTDIGGYDRHDHLNGTWKTYEQAKQDMKNYANAWRAKGTGWIVRVTITSHGDKVTVDRTTVYKNDGRPGEY